MKVNAVVKQICELDIVSMIAEYLLYPVVLGEDSANYAERLRACFFCGLSTVYPVKYRAVSRCICMKRESKSTKVTP